MVRAFISMLGRCSGSCVHTGFLAYLLPIRNCHYTGLLTCSKREVRWLDSSRTTVNEISTLYSWQMRQGCWALYSYWNSRPEGARNLERVVPLWADGTVGLTSAASWKGTLDWASCQTEAYCMNQNSYLEPYYFFANDSRNPFKVPFILCHTGLPLQRAQETHWTSLTAISSSYGQALWRAAYCYLKYLLGVKGCSPLLSAAALGGKNIQVFLVLEPTAILAELYWLHTCPWPQGKSQLCRV